MGSTDIPSRQIGHRTAAFVFVLDPHRPARRWRQTRVFPPPRLDAGLFVRRQHAIGVAERPALPDTLIQIQDAPGFLGKLRVSREDPAEAATFMLHLPYRHHRTARPSWPASPVAPVGRSLASLHRGVVRKGLGDAFLALAQYIRTITQFTDSLGFTTQIGREFGGSSFAAGFKRVNRRAWRFGFFRPGTRLGVTSRCRTLRGDAILRGVAILPQSSYKAPSQKAAQWL